MRRALVPLALGVAALGLVAAGCTPPGPPDRALARRTGEPNFLSVSNQALAPLAVGASTGLWVTTDVARTWRLARRPLRDPRSDAPQPARVPAALAIRRRRHGDGVRSTAQPDLGDIARRQGPGAALLERGRPLLVVGHGARAVPAPAVDGGLVGNGSRRRRAGLRGLS